MLNKEDKDGIIEFLCGKLREIQKIAKVPPYIKEYDHYQMVTEAYEDINDICDHALMEVTF